MNVGICIVLALCLVGCGNATGTGASNSSSAGATPTTSAKPAVTRLATGDGARIGAKAPGFTLQDIDGHTIRLADFAGKIVVLEWFNPDCPFVRLAHTTGSLKTMGSELQKRGIVWLAINSGAPGKQGYGLDANKRGRERFGIDYPILLDESGEVGRAYGATNTPHMFVIDGSGVLAYAGAIDDTRGGEPEALDKIVNHVADALDAVRAGKKAPIETTKAWGCSVKYGSHE
jgi:peroxiredoxin